MTKNNDQRSEKMNRGKKEKDNVKNDQKSIKGVEEAQLIHLTEVELGGEAEETTAENSESLENAENSVVDEEVDEATEDGNSNSEKVEGKDGEDQETPEVRGGFWHRLNVSYPWLKFAAMILLVVGVTLGGFGVASLVHGSHETIPVTEEEHPTSDEPIAEKPAEPAEPKPEEPEEPAPEPEPEEKPEENGGSGQITVVPPTKPVVVPEGATGKKLIALTFDDGPSAANTGRLLDILREKNVKVTFFVLGNLAERYPDLVRREEAEGHEVGSHTPYHNQQTKLSVANIQAEAATMNQIFINILGHSPAFTRPPYGSVDDKVRANLAQPLIIWSIDPEDWKYRNAATVRANVVGAAHDGAIALMHDIHATTVDAVPGIIDDLRAQGYEFLTVSELAKARGVTLQNGVSYFNFRL